MLGLPLVDLSDVDDEGNVAPVVTIVTGNGGPFRSFRFEAPVTTHPELRHVRTRVRPRAERVTRTRLRVPEVRAGCSSKRSPTPWTWPPTPSNYRVEYTTVRPHEAIAWNRPIDVHLGYADPAVPNFSEPQNLPST